MLVRRIFRFVEMIVTLGGHANARTAQFLRYVVTSVTSFGLDLFLLYFFTEHLHIFYLTSTALAFSIAVSVNYVTSRAYAFRKSTRGIADGYARFVTIAIMGMMLVLLSMRTLVGGLGMPYLLARILVGCFVGMWNYTLNAFWNFRR